MNRVPVSVVMPFAGDESAAREAIQALKALRTIPGDQLIFADNSGLAVSDPGVTVVQPRSEKSPAHARNTGAGLARNDWILFLDADCTAPADLLDAYFDQPIAEEVGALAGEVIAAPDQTTLAARYGAARSFLSQTAHLSHPYLPRAVAANLLVRRASFEHVGGFYEGLRAAEDTDFSWRLQQAGWALELRPHAAVEHRYRTTVRELRAQWRGYAAGRAWLRRRYRDFTPQPAAGRAFKRVWRSVSGDHAARFETDAPCPDASSPPERAGTTAEHPATPAQPRRYLVLDALLGFDELAGFAQSNRPVRHQPARTIRVVLFADRFPSRGDPLVDFARTLGDARVEANARPQAQWWEVARELEVTYREDDGLAARALALLWLIARHPVRCALDLMRRRPRTPSLFSLAPAALRLNRSPGARVHALGSEEVQNTAGRLAGLLGRGLERR